MMKANEYIYEAVDQTNDEIWFPIGIWATLEEAISSISKVENNPRRIDGADSCENEMFIVNIHKRKIGFSDLGPAVHQFEWERHLEPNGHFDDEWVWKCLSRSLI